MAWHGTTTVVWGSQKPPEGFNIIETKPRLAPIANTVRLGKVLSPAVLPGPDSRDQSLNWLKNVRSASGRSEGEITDISK